MATTSAWEELTGDQFVEAAAAAEGVCLLPLSVIERHGHHLPLGTDMFIAREVCQRAAALEPAVVFPNFIFTQILEARHCAGTIAIEADLILRLLDNVCREIARNGLKKIVLVNAHGGNGALLPLFGQMQLGSPRDYIVYLAERSFLPEDEAAIEAQWETTVDGHAGEKETSCLMVIRPDLVDREHLQADGEGMPRERLKALRDAGIYTGIWWYADHPTHYRGDGSPATADKGDRFLQGLARSLVQAIKLIKQDDVTPRLHTQFYASSGQPRLGE